MLDPGGEELNWGQDRQVLADVAPIVVEYLSAGQSVQGWLFCTVLNVPAGHGEHCPSSVMEYPASHKQTCMLDENGKLMDLSGQSNTSFPVQYTFAPHGVQVKFKVESTAETYLYPSRQVQF